MNRPFKNLFMIIAILATSIASGVRVEPTHALGSLAPVDLPSIAGASHAGELHGIWGRNSDNIWAVGFGNNGTDNKPVVFRTANGSSVTPTWNGSIIPLPGNPVWSKGELYDVWGARDESSSTDYTFAVGAGGSVQLYPLWASSLDGVNWSSADLTPIGWSSGQLHGIWGTGVSNIYLAGYGSIGASAQLPLVLHRVAKDGAWNVANITPPTGSNGAYLRDIWGGDATHIYAAGSYDTTHTLPLLYFSGNGTNWSIVPLSLPSGWTWGELYSIGGTSYNDVYVVGAGGVSGSDSLSLVYHYDGSNWTSIIPSMPSSAWNNGHLYGVRGFSAAGVTKVYLAGIGNLSNVTQPLFYRKTSGGWAASNYPSSGFFYNIWGTDANNVYVVGRSYSGENPVPLLMHATTDTLIPGDVASMTVVPGKCNGSVKLTWTAPADDAGLPESGPVETYLVKVKPDSAFSGWDDAGATLLNSSLSPAPVTPGTAQTMTVSGLDQGRTYYFAVKAQDDQGLLSANYAASTGSIPQAAERSATWYIGGVGTYTFGLACDTPVVADYNGDGKAEIAVFRPSNSTWYVAGVGAFPFGTVGDTPVVADYNGDRKAEIAIFRPTTSTWYVGGVGVFPFGTVGDIPVVADYNGDGKAEIAIFRPTTSTWYVGGVGIFPFGTVGDIPVIADYNGDGKADIAVFRP